MNIFRKNWFITFTLLGGILGSLVMSSAYPFIIVCALLMVLNSVSCIAIIMCTPIIEGFLNLNLETPIPVETFVMVLLAPVIVWTCILEKPVLYSKALKIYLAFCLLIIIGTFVALVQRFYSIKPGDVLINNFINFFRILFCIALSYFFVSLKKKGILQGFKIVLQLAPFLLIITTFYYLRTATQIGVNAGYLAIGDIKHGEFAAIIVAFSILVFYNLYNEKNWLKKSFNIVSIISMAYLILQIGSKNGLLGLALVIIFASYYFYIKGKPIRFAAIVFLLVIIVSVVIANAVNTPTIQRLLLAQTSGGINLDQLTTGRAGFWAAGINAFFSLQGFLGYGSTSLASRWVTGAAPGADTENVLHNTPLEFAIQLGVFGLVLYIILLVMVIRNFAFLWRVIKSSNLSPILLIPFLCFFSVTISGLFLSWQWQSYWWYQIAIIFALIKLFILPLKTYKKRPALVQPNLL